MCGEYLSKSQLVDSNFKNRKAVHCRENGKRKCCRALQSGDQKKTGVRKFDI